jgi:hypothetical protein
MNLTTRQQDIHRRIQSVDPSWNAESFARVWNDILKLNKFVSIKQGKLVLEFDDPNHVTIKFERENKIILNEKIYWNELIQLDSKMDETKQAAQTIKALAERIIAS